MSSNNIKKTDSKANTTIKDVLNEKDKAQREQKYNDYVEKVTPKHNILKNVFNAFIIGGIICTIGEFFIKLYTSWGADKDLAALFNTLTLVFISIVLTGFGVYSKIAKYGGAGTIVPITGFANSVAAPAIEFKKEGQVFGIGCKIFTIAGPVILYGIFSSWILGVIYYILMLMNII